jgi:hypothetical protein
MIKNCFEEADETFLVNLFSPKTQLTPKTVKVNLSLM